MPGLTAEAIEAELAKQTDLIGAAIESVRGGTVADINEVERNVAVLCNEISGMPQEDAQRLEPAMAQMISKLEELAVALHDFQSESKGNNDNGTD